MNRFQKYDSITSEKYVGDIQPEDISFVNTTICEVDVTNIGTIAVDDVVYILPNGKIIKSIANNVFANSEIGIVKTIDGTNYHIQTDGTVTHTQTLSNTLSKEAYAQTNKDGRNLVDKLDVPFLNDDTAVIVGKKIGTNKIKLSPEFFIFGDPEPNFLNDEIVTNFNFNVENVTGNIVTNLANSTQNMTLYNNPTFGSGFIGRAIINPDSNAYGQFSKPATTGDWTFTILAKMYGMSTFPVGTHAYGTLIGQVNGNRVLITTGIGNYSGLAQLGAGNHAAAITSAHNRNYNLYQYVHKRSESKSYWRVNAVDRSELNGNVVLNTIQRIFIYDGINYALNGEIDTVMIHHRAWTIEESARYWKYCNNWQVAA